MIEVKDEHIQKAEFSIEVTLVGIMTFFNALHLKNALLPIFFIPFGITTRSGRFNSMKYSAGIVGLNNLSRPIKLIPRPSWTT